MQAPDKGNRPLALAGDIIGIAQEGIRSRIGSLLFEFSDEKRNLIARLALVEIALNLGTGQPVLALALPVEEVGIDGEKSFSLLFRLIRKISVFLSAKYLTPSRNSGDWSWLK